MGLARMIPARSWLHHPGFSLAVVIGLIYVNQVLFTVYVLRVHHGDPAFIARYLPRGWFTLARGPAMAALARRFPAPGLLAPSVLRVQAFLELPFVVFAYLTVCHWCGVCQRARRLIWPACAGYTVTFCLVEWHLHNPYTRDDLIIRVVAGLVVPLWAGRLSPGGAPPARTMTGLLAFAVSAAALSWLVLVVYGTALLYNLGQLGAQLPGALLAGAALAAARLLAHRVAPHPPGLGVDTIGRSFGWWLVLFFGPALPVRYGLNFGAAALSAAVTVLLIAAAAWLGAREALAAAPGGRAAWAGQMTLTLALGLAGALAARALPARYGETRLLWEAAAFFLCAVTGCALLDRAGARLMHRRGRGTQDG